MLIPPSLHPCSANQHELSILGYPADEYIGKNIMDLYVDKNVALDYFKRLGDGKRLVDCEAALRHHDGSVRYVLMNSSVRYSRTGEFLHTRCFTQDITARKKLELDLLNAKQEAEAANQAKDQFLASLSHELRTPLTPVLMLLSLLRDDARLPSDVRDQLVMMQRSTELEARLVDDLIDVTSIRRGRLQYSMHHTDVHALLTETRSILFIGEACEGRICRLKLQASRHVVRGDASRLMQVFRNILRNGALRARVCESASVSGSVCVCVCVCEVLRCNVYLQLTSSQRSSSLQTAARSRSRQPAPPTASSTFTFATTAWASRPPSSPTCSNRFAPPSRRCLASASACLYRARSSRHTTAPSPPPARASAKASRFPSACRSLMGRRRAPAHSRRKPASPPP